MAELNLNLDGWISEQQKKEAKAKERVKTAKKKAEKYIPTWEEVWVTGYTSHTGAVKKSILQSKVTDVDRDRLLDVKMATENGEIPLGVVDMSKYSKSHALAMYQLLKESRREGIIKKMVAETPHNYKLITDVVDFTHMLCDLADEKIIGLDTETTGIDMWGTDVVVGLSITLPIADYHAYIPVRHNVEDKQLDPVMVFEHLKPHLENPCIKKVLHNAKFDCHMLRKEGIEVKGIAMDTMIAMSILNENEPSYALKNLATKYGKHFGFEDKSSTYEELFGKGGFENTPLDIGLVYAAKDTHLTYKFYKWIDEQLVARPDLWHVYYEIENPTLEVSIEMEKNGFAIDLDFAERYKKELSDQIVTMKSDIDRLFGGINVDSNQQLATFLYDELGLENKDRSVDKNTLKLLADKFEGIPLLLEYRKLHKLLSTYIEPLPQKISCIDGRLHGSFNQTATVTGRFASNNPNLQNLPAQARGLIVAPKGKVILGKDFS